MARFYPLYVRRSDGKIAVVAKGRRQELNQPTDEQLDQRPDKDGVSDYYREIAVDEPKHLDWRRKLGGMLARELEWKDKSGGDNGYILVALPENYRLYEHVKKTEKDGKLEVKSKTHAAGGNDRQDAYLYGHPVGRRKRFRSPNDFFPHLLWLCTDESGDPDNCSCKICCPEDLDNLLPVSKLRQDKSMKQDEASKPIVRQTNQQGSKLKQEIPTTALRQGPVPAPAPAPVPAPIPAAAPASVSTSASVSTPMSTAAHLHSPAPAQLKQPSPLPQARNLDQKTDRVYDSFMYRTGELTWFKRGQAWGLGVVVRRWSPPGSSNASTQHCYEVQPLSHPFQHPKSLTISADSEMRPWLAWSLPKFTMRALNDLPNPPRYETADWHGMAQHRYGPGDMEVDGSILAAKAVDSTYTLFERIGISQPENGVVHSYYNGIFLGAEKIWTGDPIRLAVGSGTDIMVVHEVLEMKRVSAMHNQTMQASIRLIGDVYRLGKSNHDNPQIPTAAAPSRNPNLPPRLTQDLAYRNARSILAQKIACYWHLIGVQQRVDLDNVKGRWYEASLLLPVVDPGRFAEANRKGEFQESSLWMNSRGDCLNSNRVPQLPKIPRENIVKESRKEAFGKAISPGVEIRDGLSPPLPENVDPSLERANNDNTIVIDPKFDTAENTDTLDHDPNHGNTFDDLMNLDGLDDNSQMPNFAEDYGGQNRTSTYFQ